MWAAFSYPISHLCIPPTASTSLCVPIPEPSSQATITSQTLVFSTGPCQFSRMWLSESRKEFSWIKTSYTTSPSTVATKRLRDWVRQRRLSYTLHIQGTHRQWFSESDHFRTGCHRLHISTQAFRCVIAWWHLANQSSLCLENQCPFGNG